jgi:hypothetical protein
LMRSRTELMFQVVSLSAGIRHRVSGIKMRN